jgi:hypothetical protein
MHYMFIIHVASYTPHIYYIILNLITVIHVTYYYTLLSLITTGHILIIHYYIF